jgi:hypothetical protein
MPFAGATARSASSGPYDGHTATNDPSTIMDPANAYDAWLSPLAEPMSGACFVSTRISGWKWGAVAGSVSLDVPGMAFATRLVGNKSRGFSQTNSLIVEFLRCLEGRHRDESFETP